MRHARAPWWSYLVPAACGCIAFALIDARARATTTSNVYMTTIVSLIVTWVAWRVVVVLTGSVAAQYSLARFADAVHSRPMPQAIGELPRAHIPSEAHVVAEQLIQVTPGSEGNSLASTMLAAYHQEVASFPDTQLFANAPFGVNCASGLQSMLVGTSYGLGVKFYAWMELQNITQSVRWRLLVAEMRNGVGVPYQRSHFSYPASFVARTDTQGRPTQEDEFDRTIEGADRAKGLQNTVTQLWMQSLQRDSDGARHVLRGADPVIEADTREDEVGRRRGRIV